MDHVPLHADRVINPAAGTGQLLAQFSPDCSNELIFQITPCTNTLCSYNASKAPKLNGLEGVFTRNVISMVIEV